MATYVFKAMDLAGVQAKGEVEAESKQAVAEQLKERGLVVVDIATKYRSKELNIELFARVNAKDLAVASRQLATMVTSGMSIMRALQVLETQTASRGEDAPGGGPPRPPRCRGRAAPVRRDVAPPPRVRPALRRDGASGGDGRGARRGSDAHGRPAREGRRAAPSGARRDDLPGARHHLRRRRAARSGRVPDPGVRRCV